MARLRSPNYPSIAVGEAIEMVRKIHSQERTYNVSRDVAAQHLGYTGVTGHSGKILASLLQYGLLQKAAKNEVQVSDTAVEILHPDTPEMGSEALYRAAFAPKLFNELRERFPGGTPSENNLRSYLVKQRFSDRAIGPAINAYLQTCIYVQQKGAYESYSDDTPEGTESQLDQKVGVQAPMQATETRTQKPSDWRTGKSETPELNRINIQTSGGMVRVDALLDAKGLDKLEKRIKAIRALLDVEDEEGTSVDEMLE